MSELAEPRGEAALEPARASAAGREAAGGREAKFLEVRDLRKYFPVRKGVLLRTVGQVQAVDGVSFAVARGTTLGLVGESGCGKTTTARLIVHLEQPDAGQVLIDGRDTAGIGGAALRRLRTVVQMIFQDPYSSLNPHHTARRILGEPLLVHGLCTRAQLGERVPAGRARSDLSVRGPRPVGDRARQRRDRGDVSRQDRRIRSHRPVPCAHAAPLQRGVAVGGAGTRSEGAQAADRVVGRRAEPAEPAKRLPVPHPLSAGRRTLRRRGTTVTRGCPAAPAGLPSPRMTAAYRRLTFYHLLRHVYHLYHPRCRLPHCRHRYGERTP